MKNARFRPGIPWTALALVFALTGCDKPESSGKPSPGVVEKPVEKPTLPPAGPPSGPPSVELIEQSRSDEGVEVCWSTRDIEACTLSILHASGEGDFFDVEPRGCYVVIREAHTLVEIFCRGAAGDANGLLHLVDGEAVP